MYPMSPDMPRRFYAERVQSWEQERTAREIARMRRSAPSSTRRRTAWRVLAQIMSTRPAASLQQ